MPQTPVPSLQNNFTAGLKTEYTGLNFPENAATDTMNCIYSVTGNVYRRLGYDLEENFTTKTLNRENSAISSYKWKNAGGDGQTEILVCQVGNSLNFYRTDNSTLANPLSTNILVDDFDLSSMMPDGSTEDPSAFECQYSDGNGYLFVYHPYVEPVYFSYDPNSEDQVIAFNFIDIRIRDFAGIVEDGVADNVRPTSLTDQHEYNLINQGWTSGSPWTQSISGSNMMGHVTGSKTVTVASGLPITTGQKIYVKTYNYYTSFPSAGIYAYKSMVGFVTSYTGTTLVLSITKVYPSTGSYPSTTYAQVILPYASGYINTFKTAAGVYPSNADVWWRFKDSAGAFTPSTTLDQVTINSGSAPKGHLILNAFTQQRTLESGVDDIEDIVSLKRPRTGTWFQGRVWFSGLDDIYTPAEFSNRQSWTENIYFSQIVTNTDQFGKCYQVNDPTGEDLFDILPSDGGVIKIQGCGSINKLFPIQNGMLVFANNGIWFITGSQGIGFAANDYTITKISDIRSISGSSFVNVNGLPYFWNEDGIYTIKPAQQGLGLTVESITNDTIDTFYLDIPVDNKKYVRGDYNEIDFVVQWCYKSVEETSIDDRFNFDRILNLNIRNGALYPHSLPTDVEAPYVHDVKYIKGHGGSLSPLSMFKYFTSKVDTVIDDETEEEITVNNFSFAEESDDSYVDWASVITDGLDYESYFVTGYRLPGKGLTKGYPGYIMMFSNNETPTAYKIQGIWDFASDRDSNRFSSIQLVTNDDTYFGMKMRKHRIRGQGYVLQIKIISVEGKPFDIMGWSTSDAVNTGV